MGSGSLKILGLTNIKNVLLVEGMAVNPISVSQLCDKDLLLQLIKDKCSMHNRNHCRIMEGERTLDNYYLLTSTNSCMNEEQLDQKTLAQQFEHTRRNDPTFNSLSS